MTQNLTPLTVNCVYKNLLSTSITLECVGDYVFDFNQFLKLTKEYQVDVQRQNTYSRKKNK